jgi:hypothetical protein
MVHRGYIIGGLASLALIAGSILVVARQNTPPRVMTSRENPIECTVYDADGNLDYADIFQGNQPIARYNFPKNNTLAYRLNLLDVRDSSGLPPMGNVKIVVHDRRGATGEGFARIPGIRM